MRFFRSTFAGDRRGSVSVISAYFFIVLSSASALTIQGSDMYVTKLQGQRTADLATLAAAATTSPIVSGSPSAMATATALNVATINGFGSSTVATTATNGGTTLNTTITTAEEMYLSQLVSTVSSLSVLSDATVKPATPLTQGCVAALTGAVQIFNSGSVSGSSCDVIADTDLEVSSSSLSVAHVGVGVTKAAEASSLGSPTSLSPTTAKFLYNATLTNPLASDTAVAAIRSHLSAMSTWPYVTSSPVQVSSPTVTSSSNNLYFSSGNNTVPNGHYGTLTIQDVTSVTFQGSGSADPTCSNPTTFSGATYLYNGVNFTATFNSGCYTFKGDFTNYWAHSIYGVAAPGASLTFIFEGSIVNAGGGGIQFPAGTFSIATNIDNTGGNWITLGDGSKVIGGTINNGHNTMNLGNGSFYLLGTSVTQRIGTLTFGNGPRAVQRSRLRGRSSRFA